MKKTLLSAFFLLLGFLPFAYSQTYYMQGAKGLPDHHIKAVKRPAPTNNGVDSSYVFLSNYIADSLVYTTSYLGEQGQLLNNYYNYPNDTLNSYRSKSMFYQNYDCINSITVAFDSLYANGAIQPWTVTSIVLDTIYIPIIQVNHSSNSDTLQLQLISVDADGYPVLSSVLLDTLITGTQLGSGNNSTIKVIKWNLTHYSPPSKKFAVNVTYFDATKQDSCWFIYGYGSFTPNCPSGTDIPSTFAYPTLFSRIDNHTKAFNANSFALWNEYAGQGFLPASTGDNVFFPCSPSDVTFHDSIDGANYLQDIDIYANVLLINANAGISTVNSPVINISQNYPNPFNNQSTINYTLNKQADVSIKVVDMLGREVLSQTSNNMSPGQHSIILNATVFSPGLYFYAITSCGSTETRKMVVY